LQQLMLLWTLVAFDRHHHLPYARFAIFIGQARSAGQAWSSEVEADGT
jgi:hypothetical protein